MQSKWAVRLLLRFVQTRILSCFHCAILFFVNVFCLYVYSSSCVCELLIYYYHYYVNRAHHEMLIRVAHHYGYPSQHENVSLTQQFSLLHPPPLSLQSSFAYDCTQLRQRRGGLWRLGFGGGVRVDYVNSGGKFQCTLRENCGRCEK